MDVQIEANWFFFKECRGAPLTVQWIEFTCLGIRIILHCYQFSLVHRVIQLLKNSERLVSDIVEGYDLNDAQFLPSKMFFSSIVLGDLGKTNQWAKSHSLPAARSPWFWTGQLTKTFLELCFRMLQPAAWFLCCFFFFLSLFLWNGTICSYDSCTDMARKQQMRLATSQKMPGAKKPHFPIQFPLQIFFPRRKRILQGATLSYSIKPSLPQQFAFDLVTLFSVFYLTDFLFFFSVYFIHWEYCRRVW